MNARKWGSGSRPTRVSNLEDQHPWLPGMDKAGPNVGQRMSKRRAFEARMEVVMETSLES